MAYDGFPAQYGLFLYSPRNGALSAFLTSAASLMLRDARMAGLLKRRCGDGTSCERPIWAVSAGQTHSLVVQHAATPHDR